MNLIDYFCEPVVLDLDTEHQFRILLMVFVLTLVAVVVVHQFLPGPLIWFNLLTHGFIVALSYMLATVAVASLLVFISRYVSLSGVRVWQLWLFSYVAYNLAFFAYMPFEIDPRFSQHADVNFAASWRHYLRILPLWGIITFVFVQTFRHQTVQAEVAELKSINEALSKRQPSPKKQDLLELNVGRKRLNIPYAAISHISVIDHYSYVHYEEKGAWHKIDFAMPLKQLLSHLNEDFVLVHRTHIVNLDQIQQVSSLDRTLELQMKNSVCIPVSRANKTRVLSLLEARRAYIV